MFLDNNDLERILGWNDGTRMAVRSEALASATVQTHEFQHGRIFHETYDGHLHRLCCMAAGTSIDRRLGGIYTDTSRILFAQTRLAHEAAATYLSIEGLLTRKIRKAEYAKHSKQYQIYYNELDDLVGRVSKSSWVRFSFAWTFIHWCFHSPRFVEFFDNLIPTIDPLIDIPSPTDRFLEGKAILKSDGRLQDWVSDTISRATRSYGERGYELWDLNNEAHWNARSEKFELKVLETELSHFGGDWLLSNMPFPTENYGFKREDFGPGFDMLMEELKLTPSHLYSGAGSILDDEYQAADLERRALVQLATS